MEEAGQTFWEQEGAAVVASEEELRLLAPPLFGACRRGCSAGHTAQEPPLLAGRRSGVCTAGPWGDTGRSSERRPEGLVLEQGWWEAEWW